MIVQELVATLGLNVDERMFKRGEQLLRDLGTGLLGLGAAAAAAFAAFGEAARETASSADHIAKTAQALGVTTDTYQEMAHAAHLSGLSAEEMGVGLRQLSRMALEASQGSEQTAIEFRKLGVSVTDSHGKLRPVEDLLGQISDRFAKMPDSSEKTALAMMLMGRSGAQMIPLLNGGSKALASVRKEAHDLGYVLDKDTIQAGVQFQENMDRLEDSLTGLRNAIGGPLINSFSQLLVKLTQGVVVVQKWIRTHFGPWMNGLTKDSKRLGDELNVLKAVLYTAALAILAFNLSIGAVSFDGILMAIALTIGQLQALAAWALGAAAAFLPFLLLSAAIVLIWDEIYTTLKGGDSLITRISKNWDQFVAWKDTDSGIVKFLKTLADWLVKILHFLNPFEYLIRLLDQARNAYDQAKDLATDPKGVMRKEFADAKDMWNGLTKYSSGGYITVDHSHDILGPALSGGAFLGGNAPVNSSHAATQTNHIAITVPPGTDGAQIGNQVADTLEKEWDRQMAHANAAADGG